MIKFRSATLLFIAVVVGVAAGGMTELSGQSLAAAVLAGGAAFGVTLLWLEKVVGPEATASEIRATKNGRSVAYVHAGCTVKHRTLDTAQRCQRPHASG